MTAADDAARMLALVPWLLQRPGASTGEAAAALGVDEQTVRRYLYHLDFCGLPGLGGGALFEVQVVSDRVLVRMADELRRPLRPTPLEALRLVLLGEAVSAAVGDTAPALRSALDKVRAALGVPTGVRVLIEEDGTRWLGPLRQAVDGARRVRLRYRGRADEQPQDRTVDPWALHVADGSWYLQGRDEAAGDLRTFRLDRIAAVDVLDVDARPPPDAELPRPRYTAGPDDHRVELVLARDARWLAEAVACDSQDETDGGGLRIRFRTDALPWVRRLVLSAGAGVEVVRPARLRDDVAAAATRALARY